MTETPPWCSSSWVDLSKELLGGITSPPRTTPIPFGSESDYMRMLKEAQSETSCRTSARVSPIMSRISTRRNSLTPSPKSPPNSPNAELADLAEYHEDLSGIYINQLKEPEAAIADFMWDWSSRPNMLPPKDWKLQCQRSKSSSGTHLAKPAKSKYSKKVVYTMVLTNILSLIIGAGFGMWLYRKSGAECIKIFI